MTSRLLDIPREPRTSARQLLDGGLASVQAGLEQVQQARAEVAKRRGPTDYSHLLRKLGHLVDNLVADTADLTEARETLRRLEAA